MKSIKKYKVIALCAVIVVNMFVKPLSVEAVTGSPYYNREVVDVSLTKTGVVANEDILNYTTDKVRSIMKDAIIAFNSFLISRGEEQATVELFYEFIRSSTADSVGQEVAKMLSYDLIDANYIVKCVNEYEADIEMNIDIYKMATGKEVEQGENITLSDELVDYIREVFNEYAESEADYYYVKTIGPNEINPLWFEEHADYVKFKDLLASIPHYAYLGFTDGTNTEYFSYGGDNQVVVSSLVFTVYLEDVLFLNDKDKLPHHEYRILDTYNKEWEVDTDLLVFNKALYWLPESFETMSNDYTNVSHSTGRMYPAKTKAGAYESGIVHVGLVSNDGRNAKIYNNLNALKLDTLGKSKYYVTTNFDDYNSNDNSIKVSGDYITGDYQYSHDVVQNEIDNSQNVDNSVVNNIVNNNQQTIINNYASNVLPETDDDNESDDNNGGGGLGSILDGLGSIISALSEIVGFLLGVIGDVIGLIGQLFNVVFEGLKAIGTLVGNFPKLLGDLFVFIPQELIDFLVLSIEASIGIAIWRKFSKK